MTTKKRPPLAWDGKKPLKMRWGIYYKGWYYPSETIACYDVKAGTFTYKAKELSGNFLVKRLD